MNYERKGLLVEHDGSPSLLNHGWRFAGQAAIFICRHRRLPANLLVGAPPSCSCASSFQAPPLKTCHPQANVNGGTESSVSSAEKCEYTTKIEIHVVELPKNANIRRFKMRRLYLTPSAFAKALFVAL